MASGGISGLTPLNGINVIENDSAFATAEQRMGGPADAFHGQIGEIAKPYSWQSLQMPAATHGPYGPENQLLDDEFWFFEPAGIPGQDPYTDTNSPSLTRSHGSVHNVALSGPLPSQYDAVNNQVSQMGNHAANTGTSNEMTHNRLGEAQQDNWEEIWEVNPGNDDIPAIGKDFSHSAFGIGVNDRTSNQSHKSNLYGYGSKHMHRRFAWSHIPGNNLWMRPQGRIMIKTIPGTAKLPIGPDSQFTGVDNPGDAKDPGFPFDPHGAVLQNVPTEYVPPPSPNVQPVTPTYSNEFGTDGIALW